MLCWREAKPNPRCPQWSNLVKTRRRKGKGEVRSLWRQGEGEVRAKEGQGTSKIRHEGHQQGFQRLDKILLEDLIIKFGYVSCLCMDLVDTIKMHQCPESKAPTAVVLALHLSLLIWWYQIKTNVILQMYYCELGHHEVARYLQELAETPFCYNK